MAVEDENPETPTASKPSPNPINIVAEASTVKPRSTASPVNSNPTDSSPKRPPTPKDYISNVASKIASQPLQNSDPHVWGVLTAISQNARKRHQGINILLTADEHCIGRMVKDVRYQINSNAVSGNHCKLYRTTAADGNMESPASIFLKDTSANGTYLNWERLVKNSAAARVCHGDIISFAVPPQHESAFAFVYREVLVSSLMPDNAVAKRKSEGMMSENKRFKGIGIGAAEGPISLDDFRSLQRSNTELRKQLENQVNLIDTLRKENHAAVEHHENELKSVKESVAKCYCDQLKELQQMVDLKQKELEEASTVSAEQKHAMEDLNERLGASMQSCAEANAIISSQKVNIVELKEILDEERTQRKQDREKAATDLKAAVQRAQSEAQEDIRRLSDAALRRERELQEAINKLQESERERCLLVETLRLKLEETRQKMVVSDNKVRQLETQVHAEQLASANRLKRVEELEQETRRLRKELESEKAAREEAWAKVSVLELEINAAMRDLEFERRRLKGSRERLMLRETQLRAFYSTTEEIQGLFAKQQEQLKAMQKTLEDEENDDNTSIDMDGAVGGTSARENEVGRYLTNNAAKAGSTTSAQKFNVDQVETSSNEASVTEKHDCDIRNQECQNTQEVESNGADNDDHCARGGFGSEINGVGTVPMMEGDTVGTERVLETGSSANFGDPRIDLNKCGAGDGDTMQFDEDANVQETEELAQTACPGVLHNSQLINLVETQKTTEDTEGGYTIRTADLLASEVAGSWACSTVPSVHGENESPGSRDNNEGSGALHDSNVLVAESQSSPSNVATTKRNQERRALSEMIGIVAPDLREHFGGYADNCDQERDKQGASSDSDTESCSKTDDDNDGANGKGASISDAETEGSDRVEENQKQDDAMDEEDEATQADSVG